MTAAAPPVAHEENATRAATAARVAHLYARHGRMTYGICRALLRDGHDAEDATQQTFLLAHRALLGGARVRNDAAWLATIARNECRTRIAASMRSPLPVSDEDLDAIPIAGDAAEQSAQREAIRAALAELPERQREAMVLRYLYGLRYGEVAAALGLSRPATEALLFRARRSLRHRLKPIVASILVVPVSVEEGLAQAIPGFAFAGSGGVGAATVGGGVLAKLTAGPVGVKVATATVAVTTVGAVGSVESERAGRDRAQRDAIVQVGDTRPQSGSVGSNAPARDESDVEVADRSSDDESGSSGPGAGGDGDGDDSSGPGSGTDDASNDDRSGPGGGGEDSTSVDRGSDSSSSGPSPHDDGSGSGSGGSGSSGESSSGSGSSDSGSSGGSTDGGSSGSGSSGSGSSDSSSGSGSESSSSGPSSGGEETVESSSGDGSSSGSSDSGSSGSGSSKSGSDSSGSGSSGGDDPSSSGSSGKDAAEVEEPE